MKKKLIASLLALTFTLGMNALAFGDISGHWSESYVSRMAASGQISGYPDGTFLPDKEISRAEFIKIMCGVFALPSKTGGGAFYDDVSPTDWYEPYMYTAMVIFSGEGMSFHGDKAVTRAEAADAMLMIYGIEPSRSGSETSVGDYSSFAENDGVCAVVSAALDNGIMQGKGSGFDPYGTLTRAELCTLAVRTVENKGKPDSSDLALSIEKMAEIIGK